MPRKNQKEYTQMQIKKSVLKKLGNLKIHPQQSYSEVIENLLKGATKLEVSELKPSKARSDNMR